LNIKYVVTKKGIAGVVGRRCVHTCRAVPSCHLWDNVGKYCTDRQDTIDYGTCALHAV